MVTLNFILHHLGEVFFNYSLWSLGTWVHHCQFITVILQNRDAAFSALHCRLCFWGSATKWKHAVSFLSFRNVSLNFCLKYAIWNDLCKITSLKIFPSNSSLTTAQKQSECFVHKIIVLIKNELCEDKQKANSEGKTVISWLYTPNQTVIGHVILKYVFLSFFFLSKLITLVTQILNLVQP